MEYIDLSADLTPVYSSGLSGDEELQREMIAERDQDLVTLMFDEDAA